MSLFKAIPCNAQKERPVPLILQETERSFLRSGQSRRQRLFFLSLCCGIGLLIASPALTAAAAARAAYSTGRSGRATAIRPGRGARHQTQRTRAEIRVTEPGRGIRISPRPWKSPLRSLVRPGAGSKKGPLKKALPPSPRAAAAETPAPVPSLSGSPCRSFCPVSTGARCRRPPNIHPAR